MTIKFAVKWNLSVKNIIELLVYVNNAILAIKFTMVNVLYRILDKRKIRDVQNLMKKTNVFSVRSGGFKGKMDTAKK